MYPIIIGVTLSCGEFRPDELPSRVGSSFFVSFFLKGHIDFQSEFWSPQKIPNPVSPLPQLISRALAERVEPR
jgi:hypothetical protein